MIDIDLREITREEQKKLDADFEELGFAPIPMLAPNERVAGWIDVYPVNSKCERKKPKKGKEEEAQPKRWYIQFHRRGKEVLNITGSRAGGVVKCFYQGPYYNIKEELT